ncbi:LacI family transcriptional regulator [Cupriavidus sp. TA19]|uniref:substrate-binding domain-containing protein n=1 Tax=unclassified Cupriavidus TaxID=2640874 RepID=UPI000E2FEAD6|nr:MULTISPECIES: substrate-binding domain-containing protein [unclassified Cupriavidus]BDB28350.1 substrate-binding domain-containing protein [Cupriavidus sp. P-10]GLC91135.1 LacI family transcriptional regulator [Cupriavidus sp. TA19]
MTQRVSVRDVAEAAGVSIGSVSRVLNETGYASAALRARVLAAVDKLGYAPSFAAKHLRTGRSHTVGYLVSNIRNPLLAAHFSEVERHLQAAGYSVIVGNTLDQPHRDRELVTLFETRRLEGIIAAPSVESESPADFVFRACGLPVVILDRETPTPMDAVMLDHRAGVRQSVDYLVSLGHRRIALFGPGEHIRPGREKLLGYQDGLQAAGIPYDPALVFMSRSAVDSSRAQMSAMLALKEPPTAMIGLGTRLLSGAIYAARKAGLDIPRDLSVIGIGTPETLELMYPPLTTLRFNIEAAAQAAAQLMLDRLEGVVDVPARQVNLPLDLVLGESCAMRK